jgi:HEAT repeat protein/VWA domain-containing protein
MKFAVRALLTLASGAAMLVSGSPRRADASTADLEFHDCAYDVALGNGECQHFLKNPAGVTDDPCWCDKCRNGVSGQRHDGRTLPAGWNSQLVENGGMECYLKRHSVAWGITCSECYQNNKPWPDGASEKNQGTVPDTDYAGRNARSTVLDRLAKEKALYKKPPDDLIVAYDKHFYLVTDVSGLKVRMPSGTARAISPHEWAHLTIERMEFARREWVRNLGEPMVNKPFAIFAIEKQRDCERFNAAYFGSPNADALNGSSDLCCGGFVNSGQSLSHQRVGDDHELQVHLRHMLAHNIVTCWATHEIRPKSQPQWLVEGLAHWLTRTLDNFKDDCTVCQGEGAGGSGGARGGGGGGIVEISGKAWQEDMVKLVQSQKLDPIEKLLAKQVVRELTPEDHKRAWSYIDFCLSEWREPFVKMLAALRQEKDVREAFMSNLGCTPEVFDERWRERVSGRRKSMSPSAQESEPETNDTPGARDRRALLSEQDPTTLAAKIRQLGVIADGKTVKCVVDLLARNSDLIRETALVTLLKTAEPDCRQALWSYGLGHDDGVVRAYVAKICGRLELEDALPKLEAQLADKNWYARAEAAVACGTMKDAKAMAALRKMVTNDPSEKAQIGAMDALAICGEDASMAAPLIAAKLEASQWQVRVAAAQALGGIGSMESVESLVARYERETGRVADEIYLTLKTISRDDLGRKAENWRTWWEQEKKNAPGGRPQRPPEPDAKTKKGVDPNDPHTTHDGGPPPYFGVEIYSNRVGFILDTSQSMLTLFEPDPSAAKALSRQYRGRDKLTIAKEEIAQALRQLDPRAHFNIVTFGSLIRSFKSNPVPASPGNVDAAAGFLTNLAGNGETNYYDALKAALDIGEEPDTNPNLRATPDTITFLTDGEPTKGDIIDGDTLLEWYTGLNRYARVKTHTISFGTIDVDMRLLKAMADRNGGQFTLVPEAPKK